MSTHAMITSEPVPAPRILSTVLRAVAEGGADAVAVQLPTGEVEAAPSGLTKAQAADPNLVVVLDRVEARSYLANVDDAPTEASRYRAAARQATAVLGWQHALGYLDAGVSA